MNEVLIKYVYLEWRNYMLNVTIINGYDISKALVIMFI